MKLDLSSLRRALESLDRGVERAEKAPADDELRDAVIQRFEYTYELCWKMLKRHLEQVAPDASAIDQLSFRELMREAGERNIISEVEPWLEYRHQRNQTSHAYDGDKAKRVYDTALHFRHDARALLVELEHRNVD